MAYKTPQRNSLLSDIETLARWIEANGATLSGYIERHGKRGAALYHADYSSLRHLIRLAVSMGMMQHHQSYGRES